MTGRAGIDVVSLAQSKWVGMGVEHGGTGLNGGSLRGGGGKMVAGGVSDMLVAARQAAVMSPYVYRRLVLIPTIR